ncbi:MAG: hypothetical protein UW60_C0003G0030 [Candidatus Woesebacteria bacterium GW2011_GWA2_44_33]|uniref:Uncharacterized protein n=1 Tax=Candidatus Woesebacteria bacterium GW2011_GWA2_44_33 TaxID=1618564 RepID=A0A0G1LG19_9BACT|nr:MAG: hypothetical protein UW60_C0003G0030 [Candidatus Woesebacteria bacterium GW2011_GWA2_44_33]
MIDNNFSDDDLEYLRRVDDVSSHKTEHSPNYLTDSANVLNASVNGSCKSFVDWALNCRNSKVVLSLKQSNSDTPPIELEALLKEIFLQWPSKEGHWLWIAQRHTARSINRQVMDTLKQGLRGAIRKTPPAYFTDRIKYRERRKQLK